MALLATLALVPNSSAQQRAAIILDAVELQGLERVSEQLVRSQLEVRPGEFYAPRAVARDLRRLFELDFFTNIKADLDTSGGRAVLTYVFEETRFIEDVTFVGNKKLKEREIRSAVSWKEGDSFLAEAYDEERDALLAAYRNKGFLNATVDIVVEELSASRVRVTYFINEGKKAKVKDVVFVGNGALTSAELRKLMKTKKARLFLGGRYDARQFEVDLRSIVDAYGDVGHLEADVLRTEFEYVKKGKKVIVIIYVSEGAQYQVQTLEIADNFVFDDEELLRPVEVLVGDVHDKSQVLEDANTIREGYETNGYINARVVAQVTLDREKKTTHIVHYVTEGSLKYIREIRITGNSVTRDDVVRRRIAMIPGERFDGSALRATQNRLNASGFFEETRITVEDVEGNDQFTDVLVDVEEGRTGNFNFGAGFSTEESISGFAEIRLNNFDITNWPSFSGGGQQFSTRFSLGSLTNQVSVSFTDPEIGGYPFSLGVDVFNESVRTTGGSNFTENNLGFQLRIGKVLSPVYSVRTALRLNSVDITNLAGDFAVPILRDLRDPGTTVTVLVGLTRSTLDRFRNPTSGSRQDISLEVGGPVGDNDFVKLSFDSTWYFALTKSKKWIISLRTRETLAETYGGTDFVPLQDRLFAGGTSTLRGYDTRAVGPKVREFGFFGDKQAIGGEVRLLNSIELKYKLSDLLRLYVFTDSGAVWRTSSDFDIGDLKYSVGLGVGIDVPRLGPMRLDFGFPLNPDSDQGNGRLHLTTGFRF